MDKFLETYFRSMNPEQRSKILQELQLLDVKIRKEEHNDRINKMTVHRILKIIANIAHSIAKLRHQIKGTNISCWDVDQQWKYRLTNKIVALLKEISPEHTLIQRGNFPEYIETMSTEDIKKAETIPTFKERVKELLEVCRKVEKDYIKEIQVWRQKYPVSHSELRMCSDWGEVDTTVCGSSDDLDGVLLYHDKDYNHEAQKIIDRSYGCENKYENWELTRKQCREARIKYPARMQGLHH